MYTTNLELAEQRLKTAKEVTRDFYNIAQEAKLALRQAEIDAVDAVDLVVDLRGRESGMALSNPHYKYQMGLCKVTQANGKKCGVGDMWRRICVWQGNERVIAFFCFRHKRHLEHFGVAECGRCGSTKPLGGNQCTHRKSG